MKSILKYRLAFFKEKLMISQVTSIPKAESIEPGLSTHSKGAYKDFIVSNILPDNSDLGEDSMKSPHVHPTSHPPE